MATPICRWEEVSDELRADMCDDGSVFMWKDTTTGESWFDAQQPPKKWRKFMQHKPLGEASVVPGVCPPHPTVRPHPAAKIVRLQKALNALARRTEDHAVGVVADGLVGTHTVKATNRAMYMYARGGAPSEFTTGTLTHGQVAAFSPQLAAYIERSPIAAPTRVAPATSPSLPVPPPPSSPQILPSSSAPVQYPAGANMYPYGQPPAYPGYYQPQQPYYYSNRGPGGLPADQASVDVKAFLPAQYEHVQVDPTTVMAAIIVGVGIYIVATRKKKES